MALMVLAGMVNKSLVAAIVAAGRPAIGLCGGDGMSFRARKKQTPDTTWAMWAKSVLLNHAGWMPSGAREGFQFCLPLRWVRMASTTTSMLTRWPQPAP